jgi:hypothetical protein
MSAEVLLKTCSLGSGLTAAVTDTTRHYYGGYFHVRIEIRSVVPLTEACFATVVEYEDARERLGTTVEFSRILEKMAVPESELEIVQQHLLDAFDANLLPYLQRDDFAPSFVRSEYRKKLKNVPRFHH